MRDSSAYFSLPYNPELKGFARGNRKSGNLSEVMLWNQLKRDRLGGLDFDRQKIIGNYIVDFYCAEKRAVVEVDGKSHLDRVAYDARRDAYLTGLGLQVIHIPVVDVFQNLPAVLELLLQQLGPSERTPSPRLRRTPPKEGTTTPP